MTSRDRLAAARAQRTQAIEMTNLSYQPQQSNGQAGGEGTFLNEVVSIQEGIEQFNENVRRIATLRLHSLNALDGEGQNDMAQVEELTNETRTLSLQLRDRIKKLEASPAQIDTQVRRNRLGLLRNKFLEAIQNYQRVEQEGRVKVRQRAERQVRIVNPDATPEEVDAIVEGGGQQVFSQALTSSTRYAESRNAYREVQQRQQDLKQMENTLAELAQLFIDMGTLVEQHEPIINQIQETAGVVEADTEKGLGATEEAVKHARSARKKRWICFFIVLICLAVVAIVLGVVIGGKH
ncbi:Syntaxin-like protein psy1 [Leucoagaricus sp. SymC.cos]|nr:Syntaxin-like protein psy1 [Leucoagaricus sp. SymC.cos]